MIVINDHGGNSGNGNGNGGNRGPKMSAKPMAFQPSDHVVCPWRGGEREWASGVVFSQAADEENKDENCQAREVSCVQVMIDMPPEREGAQQRLVSVRADCCHLQRSAEC